MNSTTPRRVVAFGGGHGLFASLRALRRLKLDENGMEITAVVTVADDGGSSGRIRDEFDILPPGDLRKALVALAAEDIDTAQTAALFRHRFSGGGDLGGHAVGNVILAGLVETLGSPVAALDHAARMLHACGRVLPMSLKPLNIEADVRQGDVHSGHVTVVRGQAEVAKAPGEVVGIRLLPSDPPACPEVVAAVRAADWLIFGPGSWYSSVLPHLLVPELRREIAQSTARRIVILNLAADGETTGLTPQGHLHALTDHAPEFHADVVIADPTVLRDHIELESAAQSLGGRLTLAPVAMGDDTPRHAPDALAAALRSAFAGAAEPIVNSDVAQLG